MLPKNLKYGSKVESAAARSYRTNIAPQNGTGTYNLGDTIIINIPTRNNLVLVPTESYLKFNATVTAAANGLCARWDSCGAHGLIQRIRVFHGSNLLSDIDSYGLLAKILFDLQVAPDASYGKYNMLAGTRNDLVATLPAQGAAATDAASTQAVANALQASLASLAVSANQINSGESLGTAIAAAGPVTNTYCLNLISLVGTLCSQNYIPLFAMTSAPCALKSNLCQAYVRQWRHLLPPLSLL